MGTMVQIVGIGVRIAAIFVFIAGISSVVSTVISMKGTDDPIKYVWWFLSAIPILLAIFMWRFPLFFARGILPKTEAEGSIKDLSSNQLMVGALIIVGIGILYVRIPELIYWVSYVIRAHHFSDTVVKELFPGPSLLAISTTVIEIGFASWLVFGGQGILNVVNRLRFAGPAK